MEVIGENEGFAWDCVTGFKLYYELVVDGFFKIDLFLYGGIGTRLGLAGANPVNENSGIVLAGGGADGRVLVTVVASRVA